MGARDASWGRARGEEIKQQDAVTGPLTPMGEMFRRGL